MIILDMSLSKQEYIYRSLKKVSHKGREAFVISRILHLLDDDEIEFVTQQVIQLRDGKRALTDLFFPQFSLHVEVDERHHLSKQEEDKIREGNIVEVTKHKIKRIKMSDRKGDRKLEVIRGEIDDLVDQIRKLKKMAIANNMFSPWNLESRYLMGPKKKKGYVDVDDFDEFLLQAEAMRCFGFKGKAYQRGYWRIDDSSGDALWFPRMFRHGMWHNKLINDGKTIIEEAITEKGIKSVKRQRREFTKNPEGKRIVFAKIRNPLGQNLFRYVGTFKVSHDLSKKNRVVFHRVSKRESVRNL